MTKPNIIFRAHLPRGIDPTLNLSWLIWGMDPATGFHWVQQESPNRNFCVSEAGQWSNPCRGGLAAAGPASVWEGRPSE